jgi:hypothetical protein
MLATLRRRCGAVVQFPRATAVHAAFEVKCTQMRHAYDIPHDSAHGTYVPPGVVLAARNAYVCVNNNKKKARNAYVCVNNNKKKMGSAYGVVEPNKGR